MDFNITGINPKGRLKYGTYTSAKNITRTVKSMSTGGNVSTGGNGGNEGGEPPVQNNAVIFLQKDTNTFQRGQLAISAVTDSTRVVAYQNTALMEVYIGDISGALDPNDPSTYQPAPNCDIVISGDTPSGVALTGVSVSVTGNGTTACTINVTVDSTCNANSGTIAIPANVSLLDNDLSSGTTTPSEMYTAWKSANDVNRQAVGDANGDLFSQTLYYYFELDSESQSYYLLDLTNDSAGINCDLDGNVLSGATRPTCRAILYYGMDPVATGSTTGLQFAISTPPASAVSGLSIDQYSGVLTFGSGFNFLGTSLEITVVASYQGYTMTKIMTVSKNYPGRDGSGATTRWLTLSRSEIKYDPNSETTDPSAITATIIRQVNDGQPEVDTGATLYWDWDKSTLLSHSGRTGTVISTSGASGHTYLAVGLKNTDGVYYELETVPVLTDGENGQPGAPGSPGSPGPEGRTGPSIIGPTEWTGADYGRRWHSGNENAVGTSLPEDLLYIDLILRVESGSPVYYFCNTSYTEGHSDTWSSVSSRWTRANGQYDFIATKVFLAQNAYIDFLTGNALYLRDSGGTISGGAQAATSSSSTIFWAGTPATPEAINTAPFRVDYQGNVYAKSGIFAGYIQMPYTMFTSLMPNLEVSASTVPAIYLSETNWQGRLPSAPENPESGMTYGNTTQQKLYYYTNRWVQVYETGNDDGWLADERAYLVQANIGGDKIVLPDPSEALNGFTYHLLILPNPPTRTPGTGDGVELVTKSGGESFRMFAFAEGAMFDEYTKLEFHGGHVEITCLPMLDSGDNVVYYWACTMCTAGADVFVLSNGSDEFAGSYYPVNGYSPNDGYYAPRLIQTDDLPGSSSRRRDVIYITV